MSLKSLIKHNLIIIFIILIFVSGCINSPSDKLVEELPEGSVIHEIEMRDFKFIPDNLEVNAGDLVKFVNSDRYTHNVEGDINLGLFAPGEFKTVKISETGKLSYTCTLHSNMNGELNSKL
ncbi:MAG: hypothetical protein CXT77_03835 [uncultured DHVE6 group euryarchaeote]|jgi:plastocyanin|nr:MAG: hypothetical protein CXT77_03835 [uncultured DHVE6 group euryarchaeote]